MPDEERACAECGAVLRRPGEYHPYAFCVLTMAGLDPWREIRVMASHLGFPDPGEHPPFVTDVGNVLA